jgi:hypothetical protein
VVQFEVAKGVVLGKGNRLLSAFDLGCERFQKEATPWRGTPLPAFAIFAVVASVPGAFDVAVVG